MTLSSSTRPKFAETFRYKSRPSPRRSQIGRLGILDWGPGAQRLCQQAHLDRHILRRCRLQAQHLTAPPDQFSFHGIQTSACSTTVLIRTMNWENAAYARLENIRIRIPGPSNAAYARPVNGATRRRRTVRAAPLGNMQNQPGVLPAPRVTQAPLLTFMHLQIRVTAKSAYMANIRWLRPLRARCVPAAHTTVTCQPMRQSMTRKTIAIRAEPGV